MSSSANLTVELVTAEGSRPCGLEIDTLVIAGWTGRDIAAMEKHIAELEAIGVPRPASTPTYYRVAASRLTTAGEIQVMGGDSSGEVEFIVTNIDGRLWVGIGSDHTDRVVETAGVTLSKQACDKPVGPELWPHDELAGHWDRLVLRAYAVNGDSRELYQEGTVDAMRDPLELIAGYCGVGEALPEGTLLFCGTLPAKGGIRPAARFEFELEDPVLGRTIRHGYDVVSLPIAEKAGTAG
jgi:hypothetical protein